MVFHCVSEFDPDLSIIKVIVKDERGSYSLEVVLSIPYGIQIAGRIHSLQKYIMVNIEKFTGIILKRVDITIGRVTDFDDNGRKKGEKLENTPGLISGES